MDAEAQLRELDDRLRQGEIRLPEYFQLRSQLLRSEQEASGESVPATWGSAGSDAPGSQPQSPGQDEPTSTGDLSTMPDESTVPPPYQTGVPVPVDEPLEPVDDHELTIPRRLLEDSRPEYKVPDNRSGYPTPPPGAVPPARAVDQTHQPPAQQPAYDQPGYGEPGYGEPGYGQSYRQPPPFQPPVSQPPPFQPSPFQQPGYPAPGYQQGQPGYQQGQPAYQQGQPAYPAPGQPAYGAPTYSQRPGTSGWAEDNDLERTRARIPGAPVPGPPLAEPTPKANRGRGGLIAAAAVLLVVLVAVAAGLLLTRHSGNGTPSASATSPSATKSTPVPGPLFADPKTVATKTGVVPIAKARQDGYVSSAESQALTQCGATKGGVQWVEDAAAHWRVTGTIFPCSSTVAGRAVVAAMTLADAGSTAESLTMPEPVVHAYQLKGGNAGCPSAYFVRYLSTRNSIAIRVCAPNDRVGAQLLKKYLAATYVTYKSS